MRTRELPLEPASDQDRADFWYHGRDLGDIVKAATSEVYGTVYAHRCPFPAPQLRP